MYKKEIFGKRIWNARFREMLIAASMMLLMLLLMTGNAFAITGSGGTISAESSLGIVNFNSNMSSVDSRGSNIPIVGEYLSNSFIDGRFGMFGNTNNVSLSILSPGDGVILTSSTVNFNYVPSGPIANCSLYIDGASYGFTSSLNMDQVNTFTANSIAVGRHVANVTCGFGNYRIASSRAFTIVISSGFDVNTTNLDGLNASTVVNLTLSKSAGKIFFEGYTDLSDGVDFSANVKIASASIYVNSAAAPMLDKPATLTLNNIPFSNVMIWRDGVECVDCSIISLSGGKLVFSVTGFSNYSVTSTSRLMTYDDSDSSRILQNQSMTFNANYTNISSGAPIAGSCNITIQDDGLHAMTYNASSDVYQYLSSFEYKGIKSYAVQCSPSVSGYDPVSATSEFVISTLPPPNFANINATTGGSSAMDTDSGSAVIDAGSSNLTELVFNMDVVTGTWQGYYGNVTGNIMLKDSDQNSYYNWELTSPNGEIYATRSPSITWEDVRCANLAELQVENGALGVDDAAGDSVTNTFRNSSGFTEFYIGTTHVSSSQNCYATHLNDNSGIQSTNYPEILLSDSINMIYTALLTPDAYGFDGNAYDFEMIVGENGHNGDNNPTMYYFYLELG